MDVQSLYQAIQRLRPNTVRDIRGVGLPVSEDAFITGYNPELEVRRKLAGLIGAATEEVALTQNATMGPASWRTAWTSGPATK